MACLDTEQSIAPPRRRTAPKSEQLTAEDLYALGLKHSTGRGVPVDYVEAHKWFNLAAMRGNIAARAWRTQLAQEMSAAQVAEAQRQAREWLRLAG